MNSIFILGCCEHHINIHRMDSEKGLSHKALLGIAKKKIQLLLYSKNLK